MPDADPLTIGVRHFLVREQRPSHRRDSDADEEMPDTFDTITPR